MNLNRLRRHRLRPSQLVRCPRCGATKGLTLVKQVATSQVAEHSTIRFDANGNLVPSGQWVDQSGHTERMYVVCPHCPLLWTPFLLDSGAIGSIVH